MQTIKILLLLFVASGIYPSAKPAGKTIGTISDYGTSIATKYLFDAISRHNAVQVSEALYAHAYYDSDLRCVPDLSVIDEKSGLTALETAQAELKLVSGQSDKDALETIIQLLQE